MTTPEMLDDIQSVKSVMQLYIDGAVGKPELLVEAFHPDARMFGHIGDARRDMPISAFIEGVGKAGRKLTGERYRVEMTNVTVAGLAAVVTLVEEDYRGCDFVNFFTFAKIDNCWKIVSKTYTCTAGEFN